MNVARKLPAAAVAFAWLASAVFAANTCPQCGCCECKKCCRLVCEMKEVIKTRYCCKCEDFCVLGPSKRCTSCCACNCGHCLECRSSWIPTAAYVKTKHVAEKKEEKIQKPTYRFVVEYVCPQCGCATAQVSGGCTE